MDSYNNQEKGYPSQTGGYPTQTGGYTPQTGGYPPQAGSSVPQAGNISAPPQQVYAQAPEYSACDGRQRNKAQSNAVSLGAILLLISGLQIGWGTFNFTIGTEIWARGYTMTASRITWIILSFYISALCGGAIAPFLIRKTSKKLIYLGAGALFLVGNILITALSRDWESILAARVLMGLGHGIVYVIIIIHSGEVALRQMRGLLLFSIHLIIMVSVLSGVVIIDAFQSLYDLTDYDQLDPIRIIGILGLIYIVIGGIVGTIFFRESPIFLMQQQRPDEAKQVMMFLKGESAETWDTRNELLEHQAMIEEDSRQNGNIISDGNMKPLLIVTASTVISVLSIAYPLNYIRYVLTLDVYNFLYSRYSYVNLICLLVRLLVSSICMIFCDKVQRRQLQTVSAVLGGAVLIITGIIFNTSSMSIDREVFIALFVVYEIAISTGLGAMPYIMGSEAFPISKKPWSLCFINAVENLLHIILITITRHELTIDEDFVTGILISFGVIIIVVGGGLYVLLPSTRYMTLRQARDEYRQQGGRVLR